MRWFRIYCEQCGWKSQQNVEETVAEQFRELQYCQDCKHKGRPASEYKFREVITSTRKGRS